MTQYHKIQTVYLRDPDTKFKTLLEGQFTIPEFEYLKDNTWTFNEKIDGTNIRIIWNGETVSFGGRTDNAQIPAFLLTRLQELFTVEKLKTVFPDPNTNAVLYGEGYGNRIQKIGKLYLDDTNDFILFDVKVGDVWLERSNVEDVAEKLSIDVAPILGEGSLLEGIEMTRKGFLSKRGNLTAEGLIMRPKIELFTRKGYRIITKIKHKDFRQ